jgi:hypothetical protein
MKQVIVTLISLFACAACSLAQPVTRLATPGTLTDSIKRAVLDRAALDYPLLRSAAVSTEVIANANTTADLQGKPLYTGRLGLIRERAEVNIPLAQWGQNRLHGTASIVNQHFDIHGVQDQDAGFPVKAMQFNKATLGLSLTYARHDSLFHRPVIFGATVEGYSDQLSSVEKLSALGFLLFPLHRSSTDVLTLGVAVIIDPASPIPVAPVVNYWHRFSGSSTELIIDLPTRLAARRRLTRNSWIELSSAISSTYSFYSLNQPPLPHEAGYTSFELKTGPSYEYRLGRKIVLGLYGGLFSTLDARLARRNADWKDYFIRNHTNTAPFVNFGVSLLP